MQIHLCMNDSFSFAIPTRKNTYNLVNDNFFESKSLRYRKEQILKTVCEIVYSNGNQTDLKTDRVRKITVQSASAVKPAKNCLISLKFF